MAEQQVIIVKHEKSMGLAYVLLIFLGQFGIPRFYLERVGSAVAQLLLGLVGWATVWILIGFIPLAILWIWVFIDLFLTAGMVRAANAELCRALIRGEIMLKANRFLQYWQGLLGGLRKQERSVSQMSRPVTFLHLILRPVCGGSGKVEQK